MLKGTNLSLRAITKDDLPLYVEWLNDVEVLRYLSLYRPFNIDDETDWYERYRKDDTRINFAIELNNGKHIGSIGLNDIDHRRQVAELGIVIGDKESWGKGYCTEAIGLLLEHGFNSLNLNRIFLRVDTENIGGFKCYQKSGFIKEGELRESEFSEGTFRNIYIMSVLRNEYLNRQR